MRRPVYAICLGVAVGLLAPTSALAARSATSRERRGITRAAAIADGSPTQSVRLTNIKVSTAGPWATATVKLYLKHDEEPEMVSEETFFRNHGEWWDTTNANAPHRTPPAAVVADLGLPGPGGSSSNAVHIIAYVMIGLIVLGLLALLSKVSGRSGGPLLPDGGGGRTHSPGQPGQSYGSRRRICPSCGGRRPDCYMCQGRGSIPNPNYPQYGGQFITCTKCLGTRKEPPPCSRCNNRGWVED